MFERALSEYGLNRCSFRDQTLIVGVGPSEPLGVEINEPPLSPDAVLFLDAADQVELIRVFVESHYANTIRQLSIGSSHLVAEKNGELDFRKAIACLQGKSFPALEHLSLGNMEQLFNGHCYYGDVGDIGLVFPTAPRLKSLEIFGHFELAEQVSHDAIQEIMAIVDDIGITGGAPSQATIDHLLSSHFPNLNRLELWLDGEDDDLHYTIPQDFFAGSGMPELEVLGFDKANLDTIEELKKFAETQNIRFHHE